MPRTTNSTATRLRGAFLPVLWMCLAAVGLVLGARGHHSLLAEVGAVLLLAWGFEQLVVRQIVGHRRSTSV